MKKIFNALLLLGFLLLPAFVLAATETQGFVPLTNIPALKFAGNAADLPNFLNSVYKICIGLAAVIGVLQLIRAGLTWMTAAGSHEKIGEARGLIRDTFLGLLLVLAPTIVFSIINPDILSLKINGIDSLNIQNTTTGTTGAVPGANILWTDSSLSYSNALKKCASQGGYIVPACQASGSTEVVPIQNGGTCTGTAVYICRQPSSTSSGTQTGGAQIVDSFKGGATAPPSIIPNTNGGAYTPNPACTQIQDGQVISITGNQETCCSYQISATVECSVDRQLRSGDSIPYCTCKAK